MRRVLVASALVHDCQVVVGHEVGRDVALIRLIRKDEVGLQVVLLSVVEELVELFVWAQVLQKVSCDRRVKQITSTHHLREYRGGTFRPAKT